MKRLMVISSILFTLAAKAEDNVFPILNFWTGYHGSVSWDTERVRISNLGLTVIMGAGNQEYEKYGDDSMMVKVCDPTGIKLFLCNDPTVTNNGTGLNYSDADKILGYFPHVRTGSYHFDIDSCVNHDWNRWLDPYYCSNAAGDTFVKPRLHRIADSIVDSHLKLTLLSH